MDDPLVENLTDAQREAVLHVEGPLLILAGPGSGKTRVVTHRIANLLRQGVQARQILALTFTNKAAAEMKARVELLAPGRGVWVSTFHRFCARMLREHAPLVGLGENFTIYDTSDSLSALKRAIDSLQFDPGHYTPQQIAGGISWAKNNLITAAEYQPRPGHPLGAIVAKIYPAYNAQLLRSSAVDFDDLLLHTAILLREHPEVRAELDARFRFVMVDEYQDTNLAQYAIVRALSIDAQNLAVTGDPDQSIYGWRGANLSNILDFEKDYPDVHVVRLERNYRSTKSILRVADRLISYNRRRKAKDLYTHNDEGEPVRLVTYVTQKDEAEGIAARIAEAVHSGHRQPRDFAVFYRVNALSRALEFALRDHGLPYQIVNGVEFYHRKEIKDILSYLILANNPRDDVAFMRVINTPARGIGKTTLTRLSEHAHRKRQPLLEAARECGMIEKINKATALKIARFVALIDHLGALSNRPVEEIMGHVLEESQYRQHLLESELEEDQERLANIEELLTAAREFDERSQGGGLEEFLEESSLVNDTDNWEADDDRVTLMTLHASKGLEFPVVFITALEHGLLPHERSTEHPDQLEEERRLLFVGITRAQEELQLSLARYREFRGQRKITVPSSFLMELPLDELDSDDHTAGAAYASPPDHDGIDELHDDDAGDDDLEFDVARLERPPREPAFPDLGRRIMTAADLVAEPATTPGAPVLAPDEFVHGMLVVHADYGLGKIIALAGAGTQRKATVAFVTGHGQRTFVLVHSNLRPAKSASSE